ncbi:MAG: sulfatase-like hydrolase/transferase, partial [Oscillospiraceae bacterium]
MRAVMVMFDSLNRHLLETYGCEETLTPNFKRLAEKSVQFNRCYAASLPCMPARRELHTGRYNFLHRSWGPMEPYDDSMPSLLKMNGIHSHLVSDHGHYWEDGGATYHTRYSTWENFRGQEGDPWKGVVGGVEDNDPNLIAFTGYRGLLYNQDRINRSYLKNPCDHPQTKTFAAGLEFLETNKEQD